MYTALQDIKLQTVDFKWIQQTTKISHLKRAIKLIELDGDFFKQLKDACYERIGVLDPSQKRVIVDNRMTNEIKSQIEKELEEWELEVSKKNQVNKGSNLEKYMPKDDNRNEPQKKEQDIDPQQYFNNEDKAGNQKKQADNQKTKGNQAIRSKDYQQAIKYYTKSITLDPSLYQSYGNRALAYLKMKQHQKALADCQSALKINPKYAKAYHRKAKALIGIKNKVQAYKALQQGLKIEPENTQLSGQLRDLRQEMNEDEIKQLQGGSQFKKIVIEEDSEDQEQEITQK